MKIKEKAEKARLAFGMPERVEIPDEGKNKQHKNIQKQKYTNIKYKKKRGLLLVCLSLVEIPDEVNEKFNNSLKRKKENIANINEK
jgi:hypothetical protein